ncbi:hypothetical protein D3C71_2126730 [compost metagenome]
MSPPEQNIGLCQTLDAQAVFRLLQCRRGGLNRRIGVQRCGNRVVHAVRIDAPDDRVGLFVDVFAPHDGTNRQCHSPDFLRLK